MLNNTLPPWRAIIDRLPYVPPRDYPQTWRDLTKLEEWIKDQQKKESEVKEC